MKTISIGDLHGLNLWKEIDPEKYDKIIFIGDYVDSFKVSDDDILNNLKDIIEFKKKYMDKVELLLGNHDLQYMFIENLDIHGCSGYRPSMSTSLHNIFKDNKDLFNVAFQYNDTVWTHAGIHYGWYKYRFKDYYGDTIAEKLNNAFRNYYLPLFDIGRRRGGRYDIGGPFWCDQLELMGSPMRDIDQIVGHTRRNYILTEYKHDKQLVFIDVLEHTKLPIFYEIELN